MKFSSKHLEIITDGSEETSTLKRIKRSAQPKCRWFKPWNCSWWPTVVSAAKIVYKIVGAYIGSSSYNEPYLYNQRYNKNDERRVRQDSHQWTTKKELII